MESSLYTRIASLTVLLEGFYRVRENDGIAGIDGVTIEDFEGDLQANVERLHRDLVSFRYRPKPLIGFEVKKADGRIRFLTVPAVRDRVAQSAARLVLDPIIDRELEKASFAYRKGYSREAAARRIHALHNQGYEWIVDADIRQFFDRVDHDLLLYRLKEVVPEPEIIDLMRKWIEADCFYDGKRHKRTAGLPQGAVISPMLANLYLDKFDEALTEQGLELVRYADDFLVLTKTKPQAEEALRITGELLEELRLELSPEKTRVTNFETGFRYLGYLFFKSLIVPTKLKDTSVPVASAVGTPENKTAVVSDEPPSGPREIVEGRSKVSTVGEALLEALDRKGITVQDFLKDIEVQQSISSMVGELERIERPENGEEGESTEEVALESAGEEEVPIPLSPSAVPAAKNPTLALKRTLYVQEQGSILKKEGERLIVTKGDLELIDLPALKIQQIILFGSCSITPAAMQFCLRAKIPIILLSSRGKYFGRLESTQADSAGLERLQILRSLDSEFTLSFARDILTAKIRNNKVFLQRHHRRHPDEEIAETIEELTKALRSVERAKTLDELRGYEGKAAAAYFSTFGRLFEKSTGFFQERFIRTRQPPRDPVNSLLSFGYTLLHNNLFSFLRARNLNPYVGYFHSFREGHPALASDLMEEFRHVVDSLVVQILNKRILTRRDFYCSKEPEIPWFLTNHGRKEFIRQFEIKMHQRTTHPGTGFQVDYRRCLDLQVQQFAQAVAGERKRYVPFHIAM